ncbi:nucleotidyltransferase domain-containing protein [Candidatus Pacearchaeota archaeon]|nr:nucleotidyltransferase domain-containing protein [Candidatus Pacearchaeota archaeon]
MWVKKIRPDDYLKRFIGFCRDEYKEELIAIGIFGSYTLGYFNKNKSDYDVFVIFKNKTPKGEIKIKKKFPKISLHHFCTREELANKIYLGHFTIFITLLTSARMLYFTKEYKKFLKEIKKTDFLERLVNTAVIQAKTKFELKSLEKIKGYNAAKWALPSIRKRLQFLAYIRKRKLIWNLKRVIRINKDLLNKEERKFILNLGKRVKKRKDSFSKLDREISVELIKKLNHEIVFKELTNP